MKRSFLNQAFLLVFLLAAGRALAQTNSTSNPQDYAKFIADRDIFDPNRQPHIYNSSYKRRSYSSHSHTESIQFVGTMSYEKGLFAFFSGSSSRLSKVSQAGDKIAGYTLSNVTPTSIILTATNKQQFTLNIGDALRRESSKWVVTVAADLPPEPATATTDSSSSATSNATSSTPSAPSAPPSTGEPNDVLKRLMQLREKENQ